MIRIAIFAAVALTSTSCVSERLPSSQNVLVALSYRDLEAVRIAASAQRGLEQRDPEGETPLLLAVTTAQFRAARVIIEHGGDIWAINEFGHNVGRSAELIKLDPASLEGRERQWLIQYLRSRGFPFPAPDGRATLDLKARGEWPPLSANRPR